MAMDAWMEVDGEALPIWNEYQLDSDLLVPSDGFSFSIGLPGSYNEQIREVRARIRRMTAPGAEVKVYVGDRERGGAAALQLTGVIDERIIKVDTNGTEIEVQGRDRASWLTDSSVDITMPLGSLIAKKAVAAQTVTPDVPDWFVGPLQTKDIKAQAEDGVLLKDLVAKALGEHSFPITFDSYSARVRLQGNVKRGGPKHARAMGVAARDFSLSLLAEAERRGKSLDEAMGFPQTPEAQRARARAIDGYANALGPADVAKLTLREARPQPGETKWSFIDRHCRRLGVLPWMAPDGSLILSAPNYDQEPSYRLVRRIVNDPRDPNTILSGSVMESIGDRYSDVTVYGRGNPRSSSPTQVVGTANDESWPATYRRRLMLQESSIRTSEEAGRRALRELATGISNSFVLEYEMNDHGQGGVVFAVDTTARVIDEPLGIDGIFYVTRRTFSKSRSDGTRTRLRLVPRGSIVL